MLALALPAGLKVSLQLIVERLSEIAKVVEGPAGVAHQLLVLSTLQAPLDEAFASTEEPRRSLVDRAFLHLNRLLTVDDSIRSTWKGAFDKHETQCETLGALHLLSHGIFAFKADADSGRTDLILGEPVILSDDVRAAAAMVLTEWKLIRTGDDPAAKALEGLKQVRRYSRVELGGFELRDHRYVVLVSDRSAPVPPTEYEGTLAYHYINIAIAPDKPSVESRRS